MAHKTGMTCYISGRVQGVWFRASTRKQAKHLGLTGWAKNLSDGRVEVVAFGPEDQLRELYHWLQSGPELAEVKECTCEAAPYEEHTGFKTL